MAGCDGEAEDEIPAMMVCILEIPTELTNHAFHASFAIQGAQG